MAAEGRKSILRVACHLSGDERKEYHQQKSQQEKEAKNFQFIISLGGKVKSGL